MTLRELGIEQCDHHQAETTSFLAGGFEDILQLTQPDRVRYDDTFTICSLCGASIIDGEWHGGTLDFKMDSDGINLILLAIREMVSFGK